MSKPNKGIAPKTPTDPAATMPPTEATLETTAVEQLDSNSNNSSNLPTDLSEMVTTDNKKSNDPDTATVLNPDDSTKNPTPTDKTDNLADPPKGTTEIAKDKEPAPVTQVTQHGVTQHGEQVVTFDHKAVKRPPTATLEAALSNLDPASIRAQAFKNNDFHIMTIEQNLDHLTTRFNPSTGVPAAESAKDMLAFYRLMKNVLESDKTQDEFSRQWLLIADRFKNDKTRTSFNGRNLFRGVQSWTSDQDDYNCYMVLVNCFEMMKLYPDRNFFKHWDPGSRYLNPISEAGRGRLLQFLQLNMVG